MSSATKPQFRSGKEYRIRKFGDRLERIHARFDVDGGRNLGDGWWCRIADRETGEVGFASEVSPAVTAERFRGRFNAGLVGADDAVAALASIFDAATSRQDAGRDIRAEVVVDAARQLEREFTDDELEALGWWIGIRADQRPADGS